MQSPDSQIIIKRFFEALNLLKEYKVIRGKQTFTNRYNINRWNLNTLKNSPERDLFQVAWLDYLVKDYMISPRWLLTGEGNFFEYGWDAEKVKNIVKYQKSVAK